MKAVSILKILRGGGTGEAGEATASPEFRGFTTEKFLASWMYERENFSCFTGKKLVPPPLHFNIVKSLSFGIGHGLVS